MLSDMDMPDPNGMLQEQSSRYLGVMVPTKGLVHRSDDLAVAVWRLIVYPSVFEFTLSMRSNSTSDDTKDRGITRSLLHKTQLTIQYGEEMCTKIALTEPTCSGEMAAAPYERTKGRYDGRFTVTPFPAGPQVRVGVEVGGRSLGQWTFDGSAIGVASRSGASIAPA